MTDFAIQVDPVRLRAAITETITVVPQFGVFNATCIEEAAAMEALCRALGAHRVLTAVRPLDGLNLGVQLALDARRLDEDYAFDRFEMTLDQSGNTQVLQVVDAGATALLDLVDPRRQSGADSAIRLIVAQLAVVLREVVNNNAPAFTEAVPV